MPKTSKNYPDYNKPFPKRIRLLLNETNTTAQTLGEHLGISQQAVNQYSFGEAKPTIERLIIIAKYFKVPTDYLLGESDVRSYEITPQAANKRYGLNESDLQNLEKITVLARLHEKHQLLTDSIMRIERTFKSTRNDNPTEDFITELLAEQKKLEVELETLETEMFELTDPGEGYFKPPKWTAPIVCQRAWQRLHSIGALLAFTEGEKVLDEIGEYLYMGDVVDGIVRTSNETISSLISGEDIAKIKLFNIQKGLVKMREEISKQNNGGLNNGTDEN